MRSRMMACLALWAALCGSPALADCPPLWQHPLTSLKGDPLDLCAYAGQVVLVVNTASHCGFTKQFSGLEALYQQYRAQGLQLLGVPSDDFLQEADSAEEIARVCHANYGVTFTMAGEQSVRGRKAHPVFKALAEQTGKAPAWNFTKYLVGRDGRAIAVFGSRVTPEDAALRTAIEQALAAPVPVAATPAAVTVPAP